MVSIWKKTFQILGQSTIAAAVLAFGILPSGAEENKPTLSDHAVVELFTSQGCSSCPPADKLLGDLAKRKDVTALTLPVDYWDYLGWKDTLANKEYSMRQRQYARDRGDRQVYTPQLVVNGVTHTVGSNRLRVNIAINRAKRQFAKHAVSVSIKKNNESIWVTAGNPAEGSKIKSGTIWLACVKKAITVAIGRGENHGRKITYYNVVRQLAPVGQWMGKAVTLQLPLKAYMKFNPDFLVAFLQEGDNGRIIGVAKVNQ